MHPTERSRIPYTHGEVVTGGKRGRGRRKVPTTGKTKPHRPLQRAGPQAEDGLRPLISLLQTRILKPKKILLLTCSAYTKKG